MSRAAPHISLVIPAFNEEKLLPALLDSVEAARLAYGSEAVEVIVADNASTDATARIAEEAGCRVVKVEPHVIAAVRNGGAAAAKGEILAFIDADSRIHQQTFAAVAKAMADPKAVAGTTGVRPDRWSPGIAITFGIFSPLFVLLKIDTGVVCCRRKDFEEIGGYDATMKFAEDIRLLWDLRALGKQRNQKLVRIAGAKAVTSTRKFATWGQWHFLTFPFKYGWSRLRGTSGFDRIADKYWYGGDR